MIYTMLCSLNFIHSANIMHRDIKPQNFLMSDKNSIKLCDFGYARTMPGSDLKVPKHKSEIAGSLRKSKV